MVKQLLMVSTLLSLTFPMYLGGQNVSVDEGVFRLTLDGEIVGREEFSIRRVGMGTAARVILRASIEMETPTGRRSLAPAMEAAGPEMSVTQYQMKVSGSESSEIFVSRADRRFLAKTISPLGEEVREYRAGPGSMIVDLDVAHQYYLLLPFLEDPGSVSLSVLSPETGEQLRMTLSFVGEEEIRVGTNLIQARHFRLEGGDTFRDLWFDAQGRVLRVEIPSRGYTAERESLG